MMNHVVVVGGGAAGMMAAIAAAEAGCRTELFEQNEKLGKKVYITGKGRCNLTNACDPDEFLSHVCTNRKFLYSAFYGFTNQDAMSFFEEGGLRIKTERGERVFPVSDHASDVIRTLKERLDRLGVQVHLNRKVKEILYVPCEESGQAPDPEQLRAEQEKDLPDPERLRADQEKDLPDPEQPGADQEKELPDPEQKEDDKAGKKKNGRGRNEMPLTKAAGIRLRDGTLVRADAVIVCTGGLSYRSTGSTGDGLRFAAAAGHEITACSPSLVPMETAETDVFAMQGLSLKNVKVRVRDGKKTLFEEFGEMMFTHFGVTGPLILSASAMVQKQLREHPLQLLIDLKPALSTDQLDARFLREFEANKNRQLKNVLGALYPAKMVPVIIARSGIAPDKPIHDLSRQERQRLTELTKGFALTITGLRDYNEAVITRGGVAVGRIRPDTMESRLVKGLFFAGEVLDVDALTGGFNLQIAWSTGYAAGKGAAQQAD